MLNFLKKKQTEEEAVEEPIFPQGDVPDAVPESNVELQTFVVKPEASKTFSHINKDFVLSNLRDDEIRGIRNMGDLIGLCGYQGFTGAQTAMLHDTFIVLNSARSKFGFQSKLLSTHITKSVSRFEDERLKKKGWRL